MRREPHHTASPAERYARALDRALASAEREAAHLRLTRQQVLTGSPEEIEAAGREAARRSGRLTRRGAILEQRARDLAARLGAAGPTFSDLSPLLPEDERGALAARVEALSEAGAALQRERRRFREALVIGRTVIQTLLDGLTQGQVRAGRAEPVRRTTGGLRRPVSVGALNREA